MTMRRRAAVAAMAVGAGFVAATGVAGAQSSPPPEVLEVRGEVVTRPAELPRTGSDIGIAAVGAGLAGVGVVLVVATRRRQSSSPS